MAKAPKKAWRKADNSKAPMREMVNYPFLHDDEESVRIRALIGKKSTNPETVQSDR